MKAEYCYVHPHPAVTTDIVVFTVMDHTLSVLLIERRNEPYKGKWALPGGFVNLGEDLEAGASRELNEETGVDNVYLEQLFTFGAKDRDPRERVITVAYFALVPQDQIAALRAGSDAKAVRWFSINNLPPLAFDHRQIIRVAEQRIAAKTRYSTVALQFLPEHFTLTELQQVYEVLRQEPLDKRNFRKWIMALDCLEETGEFKRSGQHRPAKLYRAKCRDKVEFFK